MRAPIALACVAASLLGVPGFAGADAYDCAMEGPRLLNGGVEVCTFVCHAGQSLSLEVQGLAVSAEANCGNVAMGCENLPDCSIPPTPIATGGTGTCIVHSIRGVPVVNALPGLLQHVRCTLA
ncbi:MAG: hypothetical protein LC624_12640 [Halobacteriales archaeon]|nr:hypothetical protein [Halobacteriales archaeon]